ncbi:STAS domain-containing protein [Rhodobacter capsulatus]|uniref:STAS domain-containing protein n=1 Tax=Rhodobacter capsulatus TaxID=1061 RepID=UPI00146B0EDE|nr:STAS domain-containing protein [Rhodobacter capsulatus]
MTDDTLLTLAIPADLTMADAEDCRQRLLGLLGGGDGAVMVRFEGEERLGVVAMQLALAAAAAAEAAGRSAGFDAASRDALEQLGWEG